MYVKIMSQKQRLVERDEVQSEEFEDHILVTLLDKGSITDQIKVPQDAPVVYICNQVGRTIQPFFWPPKKHNPFVKSTWSDGGMTGEGLAGPRFVRGSKEIVEAQGQHTDESQED